MKYSNTEDRVHILNSQTNVWSVITEIANTNNQEEAFYVCDIGDIVRKHKIWMAKMPRVKPHYAVKCNDSLLVLEILNALGTGFDCASKAEISKVMSVGVAPDRIIFANPAKPASHIRHAESVGVSTMTFDNESELHKIKKLYPNARLVIRIRIDAEAQCQLGNKFGCDPVTEAPELLRIARSLDLEVVGVSFHVGSGCREPSAFRRAISAAKDVFEDAISLGYDMNLLDIGGGYPGDKETSIDEIAEIVNESLDVHFPDSSIQIISEPGRFYVSSAYTLACNIHSMRNVIQTNPNDGQQTVTHRMYYINDGVYGSFNCILYDHQVVKPQPLMAHHGAKRHSSSIWGPTCDGLDQVVQEVLLPDMKVGDWLVFEDMGAYTLPVASPFNGFPIPQVHVAADESIWNLLKELLPLSENHFEMLGVPSNLKHIDNINETHLNSDFEMPLFPIRIEAHCGQSGFEDLILDFIGTIPSE